MVDIEFKEDSMVINIVDISDISIKAKTMELSSIIKMQL